MKFFHKVSIIVIAIGTAAFCFCWISGWQIPAHASDLPMTVDHPAAAAPPVWVPVQEELVYPKPRPSDAKAKAYYNLGTAYYKKGNFNSAVKYLSLAITLEPKAADAYFNRGLSYRRQHKIEEAISDFSSAIGLQSGQAGYYFERCNAFIVKNNFPAAISDCTESIRLSPGGSETYFLRGLAYRLNGDLDKALADSMKALQMDPDYTNAKRLLAEILNEKKDASRHV